MVDLLVDKISKESGVNKEEIEKRIVEKQEELSGLISREGAAYIVGRELGVNLIKEGKRELQIKNLVAGLSALDIKVDILRVFDKREFDKNGKKGCVLNLLVGDETGKTRLVLWNNDTDIVEQNGLKQGDIIKVTRAIAKKNNLGEIEIGLAKGGSIEKIGVNEGGVGTVGFHIATKSKSDFNLYTRTDISDIKDGFWEIKGCVVQVFKRNPFFLVCPSCDGKIESREDGVYCNKDGKVEPKKQLIISAVVDDGTATIRTVFFREVAEKLVGKIDTENPEDVYNKLVLGTELVIKGKVKMSDYTKELEMVANAIDTVDIRKECEKILGELETA